MVNAMAMLPSMVFGFDVLEKDVAYVQELPVCSRKNKMNCRNNVVNTTTMLPSKAFGLVDFLRWGCCRIFYVHIARKYNGNFPGT